jgi:PAS domain S-box-containing protein
MPSQVTGFETVLEAVPDALVGVDQSGVVRLVNHQAESLFAYDRHDLIGVPIEMLVPDSLGQVHAVHRAGYNKATSTPRMGTDLELTGRRRDGTQFPVSVGLSLMDTQDGLLVVAAVRDTTGHKKADKKNERWTSWRPSSSIRTMQSSARRWTEL